MVIYTNWFIPERFQACNYGPITLIRPVQRDNAALHAHEATHERQFYRTFGLMGILYVLSRRHRQQYEVEAYREQLKFEPQNLDYYANSLATKYDLDITVDEARGLLAG
ncbi:MAG: hypothetical protein VB131_04035 [Burkholderia gladioli]